MTPLKFLAQFLPVLLTLSQLTDLGFIRLSTSDGPVASRMLLMDDPSLKFLAETPVEEPKTGSISLKDVTKVIGSVISSNDVSIDAQSQEGNNLDYQLDFKNRKLSLVVNVQKDQLELKISSDDKQLDKASSFSSDKSSTEEIKTFLTESLGSLQKQSEERKLVDQHLESTDSLLKFLQKSKEFEKNYTVDTKKHVEEKYISIHKKGEAKTFCYAEIDGSNPKYLKLKRNLPEEKEAHQLEHSLFIRKLVDRDSADVVVKYILKSLATIEEQEKHPNGVKLSTLADVVKQIQHYLREFNLSEKIIGNKKHFSYLLLSSEKSGAKDNRAQILVFKQPESTVGIEFVIYDRQYDALLPLANFEPAFEEVKQAIDKMKSGIDEKEFNKMFDVDQPINAVIRAICLKNPIKVRKINHSNGFDYTTFQHTPDPSSSRDGCIFGDTKIVAIQYNYGYVHFIHLVLDNPLLRSEYMLSPHSGKIEESIGVIFSEIKTEIEEIEKMKPLETEQEITSEILEKTLKEALPGFKETGNVNENKFAFISEDQNREIKVRKEKEYFKISFLIKKTDETKVKKFQLMKQIFIRNKDLRDQTETVKRMAGNFIKSKGL